MINAADRKSIKAAERKVRADERARGNVLVEVMSTKVGRSWIWDQLTRANIFSSTYSDEPGRMAFQEGQRSAGLSLLSDVMQRCPEEFILAMREANERRTDPTVNPSSDNAGDGYDDDDGRDHTGTADASEYA